MGNNNVDEESIGKNTKLETPQKPENLDLVAQITDFIAKHEQTNLDDQHQTIEKIGRAHV